MENNLMDLGPLTRLKESLEIANNNTSSMLWKLKDFDTRLLALDKKLAPIQNVCRFLCLDTLSSLNLEHIKAIDSKK
jgi:hypothetical protein